MLRAVDNLCEDLCCAQYFGKYLDILERYFFLVIALSRIPRTRTESYKLELKSIVGCPHSSNPGPEWITKSWFCWALLAWVRTSTRIHYCFLLVDRSNSYESFYSHHFRHQPWIDISFLKYKLRFSLCCDISRKYC